MNSKQKEQITAIYLDWAQSWGVELAFAITQNVETAERCVADALVGLIASNAKLDATLVTFARAIWEASLPYAHRKFFSNGVGATTAMVSLGANDSFFKMPPISRALVVLKLKTKLSKSQIAQALSIDPTLVDDHLENARLLFSSGKPWIRSSQILEHQLNENLFASYIGNDLKQDEGQRIQSHLINCNDCREEFTEFKKNYTQWMQSLPWIEVDTQTIKSFKKISKKTFGITNFTSPIKPMSWRAPRFWPGFKRSLSQLSEMSIQEKQTLILSALTLLFLYLINK